MTKFSRALTDLGLRENPFAPTADPHYFYAAREHKTALFRLWSHIDERLGAAVLLGGSGTGKTTLLRKLVSGMTREPERYNLALIGSPLPSWNTQSLMDAIIEQFAIPVDGVGLDAQIRALNGYLIENRNRINTLIIDDAQNLNKRGQLEILRLALNLETSQYKLLNIVCFAQPEWGRVLNAAPSFRQRINVSCSLQPLAAPEIRSLIEFRLRQAGWEQNVEQLFEAEALRRIQLNAKGAPRTAVTLCRNALMLAAQTGERTVSGAMVDHTIERTVLRAPLPAKKPEAAVARAPQPAAAKPHAAELQQPAEAPRPIAANDYLGADGRPVIIPLQRRRPRAFESQANRLLASARERRQA